MRGSPAGAHVVITGATSGIGKETAIALAAMGAHVTLGARDPERGADALAEVRTHATEGTVSLLPLDLASLASVRAAAAELLARDHPIHVLVDNAGVAVFGRRRETADGFERQLGVNHLGHFLFTTLLADRLIASAPARVVVVSSAAYGLVPEGIHWDDVMFEREYDGWKAYAQSKLANLLFTFELARRLDPARVTANALHPGFVDTQLGHRRPEEHRPRPAAPPPGTGTPPTITSGATSIDLSRLDPPVSAATGATASIHLARAPELAGTTGAYFDEHGRPAPLPPFATDADAAARLWALSEALVTRSGTATHPKDV